jgi:hypothetical protein
MSFGMLAYAVAGKAFKGHEVTYFVGIAVQIPFSNVEGV